jgi:crotonobetainyl-CoA:carnitine CoA-transferase CaiB-like acyl-CoA transferase
MVVAMLFQKISNIMHTQYEHNSDTTALNGLRVLDMSRVLAGPLCAMMLGDMGADVIKLERPVQGDETRGWGPPFDEFGESAYFICANRNKKSVTADLASASGRNLAASLARGADVVVENFRPGALERLELDADRLRSEHPGLVWLTITGFGADSDRPGYDFVVQAERGWMAITGAPDGAPTKVGVALVDVITGKDAAAAVLAALVARGRTGRGAHIHVSLSRSATSALMNVAQNVLVSGRDAARWGNAHPNLVPYELFQATDRAVAIAVGSDTQWQAAARVLGLELLAVDGRLATNAGRLAHRDLVVRAVAERVRTRSASEWVEALAADGVPCGVVRSVKEALREEDASPRTGIAPPYPGAVRLPPPRLDEHGETIRRLGWDAFRPEQQREVPR